MEDSHPEGLRREVLGALHRLLRSRGRVLERVYTQEVKEGGVGRTNNLRRLCRNIMSLSRDSWRRRSEMRRGIHDRTERETSYYGYLQFNFKSSVPMFSTSFYGDNKLVGNQTEMHLMDLQHQHIFFPSATFTKSEIKPDKSSLLYLLPDSEILRQMSSTN